MIKEKNRALTPQALEPQAVQIKAVKSLTELEPHAEAWNGLACRAPSLVPDQSHAWVASYLEHALLPGESWFCFLAFHGEVLIGVLPVIVSPRKLLGIPCHTFRAPYNDQTASIDCLVEPGLEETIIPLFLKGLRQTDPTCFCFEMRRLPECSPTLALVRKGWNRFKTIETFDGYGTFIKIEGTFEDYCTRLGTKFTRNLRRLERKFFALPGAILVFVTGQDLTGKELEHFMAVEGSSWKCTRGSALCQCDSLALFYAALIKRLMDVGWLEWHFLLEDGKTIAANLAIRVNRSLIILKTCYDEAYSSFSPGTVLFGKMFERAFKSGEVDEVNLLTDYAWNQNWQVEKRKYYNLVLFPRRPFPQIAGYWPLKTRKTVRQWPGARPLYHYLKTLKRGGR
jgi:CelD/BcsL family acetyltransferase involved in cellulose biosynthesis